MFRSTSKAASIVLSALVLVSTPASAQWMATEVTQWMNHGLMVDKLAEQVKTVTQLAQTYQTNLSQLAEVVRAGQSLQSISLPQVLGIKQDIDNYQGVLKSYGRDLSSLKSIFDTRLTEARIQNLSFVDYMQREQARIASGNDVAKARVDREMRVMDQVRRDADLAAQYGSQIPSTIGLHQSVQLLNAQSNLALQQLNQLVVMKAEAQGSDSADEASKAAQRRAEALETQKGIGAAQGEVDARNEQLVRSMRGATR